MKGPGPIAGRWLEVESSGDQRSWEWTPINPDEDPFIKEQGAWIFKGSSGLPEALDEIWMFVGERPTLDFQYEKESYGTKFGCEADGTMVLAADSGQAIKASQYFEASWHKVDRELRSDSPEVRAKQKEDDDKNYKAKEVLVLDEGVANPASEIIMSEALTLESDREVWAKKVNEQWIIRLFGPEAPGAGVRFRISRRKRLRMNRYGSGLRPILKMTYL